MPQASDEQRAEWGISEDRAMRHLDERGFVLGRDWYWRKPSPDYVMTAKDWSAIDFLCDEWDFGGLYT